MSTAYRVNQGEGGERLDVWLSRTSGHPRAEVHRWFTASGVSINGVVCKKSDKTVEGTVVDIEIPQEIAAVRAAPDFDIRYEDEHLAVVSKPAGVVVHPGTGNVSGTLVDSLRQTMSLAGASGALRPGIVHRLDKDTSGLLIVAKTDETYERLIDMMKARKVTRSYLALVLGTFAFADGRIEAPIGRSERDPTRMDVTSNGKEAATEFGVIEQFAEAALINATLLTGRTHQIRVHMKHIDHPVVGDRTYGPSTMNLARRIGLSRMFLHATMIAFEHPQSGVQISIEEPLPSDLEYALATISKIEG